MPDRTLIRQKLAEIVIQLKHLEKLAKLNDGELFGKAENLYFAERVMERMITAAIDINMHLVSDLSGKVPEDYFDSFLQLAHLKILPLNFARHIAPSTSLRNILVHEYQKIDSSKFRHALSIGLKDYKKYAGYIERSL